MSLKKLLSLRHSGAIVSTVISQREGSGEPADWLGSFCVQFKCSPLSLRRPPQSKDMKVSLNVDSKLPVGVHVSANGCLSVSPVILTCPLNKHQLGLAPAPPRGSKA